MKAFFALCRVSFKGLLLVNGQHGKAGKKVSGGNLALVLLCLVCLYIGGVYSFVFASALGKAGAAELTFALMAALSAAAGFLFCAVNAAGFLFGGKDSAFLLTLPVSAFAVVLSRLLALYLENLFFTVCFLLPSALAVSRYGHPAPAMWLFLLPVCLLLPLLPAALALVVAFFAGWFESRGRFKTLLRTVLYLVFFTVVMLFSLRLNSTLSVLAQNAEGLQAGLALYAPVFLWVADCLAGANFVALGKLAVVCVVPILVVAALFGRFYRQLVSRTESRLLRTDYRLGQMRSSGVRKALYRRELTRYVTCTIYLFNTGVGMLLLLGGCGYLLFSREKALVILSQMGLTTAAVLPLAALALGFLMALTCVTAPSISLEGSRFWILKSLPLDTRELFWAKLALQQTVTMPALAVSCVLLCAALALSPWDGLVLFCLGSALSLLVGEVGLFANLALPKLDGANDTIIVKQSASVLAAMLAGAVFCAAGAGCYRLLRLFWAAAPALWALTALCLVLCAVCWRVLVTKGRRMFAALC